MSKKTLKSKVAAKAAAAFKSYVPKNKKQRLLDRPQYKQVREYIEVLLELNADLVGRMSRGEQEPGEAVMSFQAICTAVKKEYNVPMSDRAIVEWLKLTFAELSKTTLAGRHG